MNFYKQIDNTSCQIVALQTVLSFYDLYPPAREIKLALPKHSYGNSISELGAYLSSQGINAKLITSATSDDIQDKPVIINVNWYKIKDESEGRTPHYVVAIRENETITLYDGSNYDHKVNTNFDLLFQASQNINKSGQNGMWLICE